MRLVLQNLSLLLLVLVLVSWCGSVHGRIASASASEPEPEPAATGQRQLVRITVIGDTGNPPPEALPLAACTGDCDSDADCAEGLICFQRGPNITVPGCEGGDVDDSQSDYCIDPNADATTTTIVDKPTGRPSTRVPSTATSTTTTTRAPTLKPTRRPTDPPTDAPRMPSSSPSQERTLEPTQKTLGKIEYVGNDGTFYSQYPLPLCKGDCDSSDDCAEGLYCHERASYDPVPYCEGGEDEPSTSDFCTWDGVSPLPEPVGPPPEGYFRLKLYWEEGYLWQNETFEREWCMTYDYQGYPGTGLCWFGEDAKRCEQNRMFFAKCLYDEPRMWFTFVNVSSNSGLVDERLIMTGDNQHCFTRNRRDIHLDHCDESNYLQRWIAMNGTFDGPKFELSQLGFTHQLVTSDHHPKSGEVVGFQDSEAARSLESQTSYWERV